MKDNKRICVKFPVFSLLGEPFLYTNWKMDEPDSWQANYVMLSRSNSFMWEDRDCATNSFFVCQEGNVVPLGI